MEKKYRNEACYEKMPDVENYVIDYEQRKNCPLVNFLSEDMEDDEENND